MKLDINDTEANELLAGIVNESIKNRISVMLVEEAERLKYLPAIKLINCITYNTYDLRQLLVDGVFISYIHSSVISDDTINMYMKIVSTLGLNEDSVFMSQAFFCDTLDSYRPCMYLVVYSGEYKGLVMMNDKIYIIDDKKRITRLEVAARNAFWSFLDADVNKFIEYLKGYYETNI